VKYTFEANRLGIVFFDQIVQYHHISDDFSGLFIVLSKRFSDNPELNIKDSMSSFFTFKTIRLFPLTDPKWRYFSIIIRCFKRP
jgi:hypothetical protein